MCYVGGNLHFEAIVTMRKKTKAKVKGKYITEPIKGSMQVPEAISSMNPVGHCDKQVPWKR